MKILKIGKSSINDIVLLNDSTISRSHAELIIDNQSVFIVDLNSLNGTFVNGNKIAFKTKLNPLDVVKIGLEPFNWRRYAMDDDYDNKFPENDSKKTVVSKEKPDPPKRPDNYLTSAILVTIFCCQPFGIAAIVHSSQVNTFYESGNYEGAQQASEKAIKWINRSVWIGVIVAVIYFFVIFSAAL